MEKKTFKDYFDKIYCINYIEAKQRRECIIDQLTKLDLLDGVEFSYGMPFDKIRFLNKHLLNILENSADYMTTKSIGCSLNHYSAIKMAYELGYDSVLIFEDDTSFLKDRNIIIKYLDDIPNDWDFLYFTPTLIDGLRVFDEVIKCVQSESKYINLKEFKQVGFDHHIDTNSFMLNNGYVSSCAYALNKKAMNLYINLFENDKYIHSSDGIEYFFNNISQSPLISYTTNIRLFAQMSEVGVVKGIKDGQVLYDNIKFGIPLQTNLIKENFYYYDEQNNSIIYNREINIERNISN